MEGRGTEAQIIQIPKHDICTWLHSAPFAVKLEHELSDLPNIHRGV